MNYQDILTHLLELTSKLIMHSTKLIIPIVITKYALCWLQTSLRLILTEFSTDLERAI